MKKRIPCYSSLKLLFAGGHKNFKRDIYVIYMAEEKPNLAFILSLAAGIIIFLASILATIQNFTQNPNTFNPNPTPIIPDTVALIFGILIIIGAVKIISGDLQRVRTWGVIVLIFSILSLFTSSNGLIIGPILGVIGGAFALNWKPSKAPSSS